MIDEFDFRVSGIPCTVVIDESIARQDDDCGAFDWHLLDRNGKRARWLEAKITDVEEQELFDIFCERERERKYDYP